jgi:hypothetical protein
MFLETTGDKEESQERSLKEFIKEMKDISKDVLNFPDTLLKIESQATRINSLFGQNRQRIDELTTAVTNSSSAIISMGGDYKDVGETIVNIATASRRNVIATEQQVEELFAASKVLGESSEKISSNFIDAGLSLENIRKEIGDSVKYIQNIGGNASQVYKTILDNTDKINRFNFENGVQGITRMAAQASMLRFDMNQTFQLADKVLSPEGAIEVASAFQRLGVAAGNLADPFQLMNMSINDPEGLQDSLVEISKQFTYFDEKTKTFKINPQGILTLKEIEKQTGVSAKEMTKLGLASAELDERLSQISPSITFENEEDRMFLANIGRMGEGGEYEVKLKDDDEYTKLSELSQKQIDELIDEQKDGNKGLIETARDQLSLTKLTESHLKQIRADIHTQVIRELDLSDMFNQIRGGVETSVRSQSDEDSDRRKFLDSSIGLITKEVGPVIKEIFDSIKDIITGIEFPNIPKLLYEDDIISHRVSGIQSNDKVEGNNEMNNTYNSRSSNLNYNSNLFQDIGANMNKNSIVQNNLNKSNNYNKINRINNDSIVQTNLDNSERVNEINQIFKSNNGNLIGKLELISSPIKGQVTLDHKFPAELSTFSETGRKHILDIVLNDNKLKDIIGEEFKKMNPEMIPQ